MQDYFQKIASRLGPASQAGNAASAQILPQAQTGFPEMQNGFNAEHGEEVAEESGTDNSIDKHARIQSEQTNEGSGKNNTVETASEIKRILPAVSLASEDHRYQQKGNKISDDNKPREIIKPGLTVIEKIRQRNVHTTVIEKQMKEALPVKLNVGTSLNAVSFKEDKEDAAAISNEKEKPALLSILPVGRINQQVLPVQNVKEQIMLPVEKENTAAVSAKKIKHENKLVIGRITIEVVKQPPTPVKAREARGQNNAANISKSSVSHINKLSFGLGQF